MPQKNDGIIFKSKTKPNKTWRERQKPLNKMKTDGNPEKFSMDKNITKEKYALIIKKMGLF